MRIIVCVKQVPLTSQVKIDPETGIIKRSNVQAKLNPYDLFALEAAFLLREKHGGHVSVVTMGPPDAAQVLREAYFMGADDGFILTDANFAGADALATAYTISQGIRTIGEFDLIICGKQTSDGETAQVGPAIAEYLMLPHVVCAENLEAKDKGILVRQELSNTSETVFMNYPCLISVERGSLIPRLPSYRRMKEFSESSIRYLSLKELPDQDEENYGIPGSPTKVIHTYPPVKDSIHEVWTGGNQDLAVRMAEKLKQMKYL